MTVPGCGPVIVNAGQSGYYRTLYGTAAVRAYRRRIRVGRADRSARHPVGQLGARARRPAAGDGLPRPGRCDAGYGRPAGLAQDRRCPRTASTTTTTANPRSRHGSGNSPIGLLHAGVRRTSAGRRSPGEPSDVAILRNDLIETLGALGDPAVIAEARRRYAAQATDPAADACAAAQVDPRRRGAACRRRAPGMNCTRRHSPRRRRSSATSYYTARLRRRPGARAPRPGAGADAGTRRDEQRRHDRQRGRAAPRSRLRLRNREPGRRHGKSRCPRRRRASCRCSPSRSADPAMIDKINAYAGHTSLPARAATRRPPPRTSPTASRCAGSGCRRSTPGCRLT